MLTGTFKYGGFIYNVSAYDYGDTIVCYLYSSLTKGTKLADNGVVMSDGTKIPASWKKLYCSISSGKITVDQYYTIEDDTLYKNEINDEFFCYFGSIIRGMKAGCNHNNLVNEDELYHIEFNPKMVQKYAYCDDCTIDLQLGIIRELHYVDTDGVSLDLEEDGSYTEKIFKDDSAKHKPIKLDLSTFVTENIESSDWDFGTNDRIFSLQEIIERNPDKDYVWLKERKYHIIKSKEELESVCKKIWQHDGIVAFDTETTGLNVTVKSREGKGDRLVGMVFSIEPGEAYYFPVAHKKIKNICTPGNEDFIIEKYFKPILENKPLLCHNGAYDWKVMHNYGICINLVHDTYILFKVTLWNDHTNLLLSLKKLTKTFLGRDSFELSDFVEGKFDSENIKFWDLDYESVKYYACPDTDNDLELFEYAMKEDLLGKYDARKIYEIEVAFSIVIAYQEYYGHHVDITKLDDLVKAIQNDINTSYARLVELAGTDFNPKSSPDMQKVCFRIMGLPVIEKTDSGNPSTGKETRKVWLKSSTLSDEQKEFVRCLNTYLDARTLESNFTKNIGKYATDDGLMFSEVEQFLATGRVSTKNPNYQGYSDTVKKYINARPGYYCMDADYSSVEARIMCSMAGCANMVEKLKDPDADYHRLKASDMFGVPYELVTDALRKMSKGVNFGLLYGLGDPNLGVNLYGTKSPENTRKAKKQKELYFKGMEELKSFIEISRAQGTSQNFSTTYFKRRRYYDPRKESRDRIERQSCNARIQGTAADIYKLAMVRLFYRIKNNGWLGRVLISAFVHDECFLEVHNSINPAVMLKELRNAMMLEIEGWCPLYTGMGYGRNWYEAKHTEIPVQVQQAISDNYGDVGFDWWTGDAKELCDRILEDILEYKRDRVLDYLKDESNWNKVFKPTENELCHSLLKDINSGLTLEGIAVDVSNGVTITGNMLEDLKEFCRVFDCIDLYNKANIQAPELQTNTSNDISNEDDSEESDEEEINPIDTIIMRVNTMGIYSRSVGGVRELYFNYDEKNPVFNKLVHDIISKDTGDVTVYAIKNSEIYSTGLSTSYKVYPKLLQLFLSKKNMGA
jgi:DNA polymerase-1